MLLANSDVQTHLAHYSGRQLRAFVRQAQTADDHERLAAYFESRASEYRAAQSRYEQILAEYLAAPQRYPSKYPTRGDVARDLAAYYAIQARNASAQAAEQKHMAERLRSGR
jgi:hypothetical protein